MGLRKLLSSALPCFHTIRGLLHFAKKSIDKIMRPRKGSRTRKSTRGRTWQKEIEDDDIGYAAKLGTKLSDLSNSSEEEVGASTADESTDRFISFERDLRQKHSKACKAMSVRSGECSRKIRRTNMTNPFPFSFAESCLSRSS